jgi:hypothetical protein
MSRRAVAAWLTWLSLGLAAWARPVEARGVERTRRVILMQPSPALERALRTALMPWGMRVARSQTRARSVTPRNREQARVLARQLRADALVWLSASSRQHQLWLYDNASGALTIRGVPAPPFDETRAAALALSVKTELRKGTLADLTPPGSEPAAKRVVPDKPASAGEPNAATAADASTSAEVAPPKPVAAPQAPLAGEADGPRRASSQWREPFEAPTLRLLLHAGARGGASSLGIIEGRYGVEGRWAPWANPTSLTTLWLGARFDLGLPQTIDTTLFRGEYSEIGAGLGVGASVHVTRWLDLGVQLGASVYTASMSGTLLPELREAEGTRRYGSLLYLRPEVELSLGTFGFVVQPALGAALARQRYEDQLTGSEVMEMSPVWWQLGAAFRVDVD